jgi:hypothetical protein
MAGKKYSRWTISGSKSGISPGSEPIGYERKNLFSTKKLMTRKIFLIVLISSLIPAVSAQIRVSDNHRYLQTRDGKPFFWLGDTNWEMFHRLNREEIMQLITTRKSQGFSVLQGVALAEFNGIRERNRYGDLPLHDEDPSKLATTPGADPADPDQYDYWDHVDFAIREAAKVGIYIGLLPTWGDKVTPRWGEGPVVFDEQNAETYGKLLAERYENDWNVLWILGGDRPAIYESDREGVKRQYDHRGVWRAMAKGIQSVLGEEAFITYHPWGNSLSTSQQIHHEPWLDMNAFQSGHGSRETKSWEWVKRDLDLVPPKPTLDMEPCYEDHPVNPWDGKWTRQRGYFNAHDVRARIYRSIFAGACGVTYGHHQIWQFLNEDLYKPINVGDTIIGWQKALYAEAAGQMKFLKSLILSRPFFDRIADQSIVRSDAGKSYLDAVIATRDGAGTYAMIYLPQGKPVTVDLGSISGKSKNAWWFNPRSGGAVRAESVDRKTLVTFIPSEEGKDWILVIDDASQNYPAPGTGLETE